MSGEGMIPADSAWQPEQARTALTVIEVEKISHNQAAITAGYRAGMALQEKGWMRYPAVCWDQPALLAFAGQRCVAGINFREDTDNLRVSVDFAWCDRDQPRALALLLLRFRAKFKGSRFPEVQFTCHDGNEAMAKCVRVLGLTPISRTYRMAIAP